MEWYQVLALMFGVLTALFLAGMPVAFAFLLINIGGLYFFMGGAPALGLMVTSAFATLASFVLAPILLFILMGEIMFRSGIAIRTLDALDKWIGGVPGRLSLSIKCAVRVSEPSEAGRENAGYVTVSGDRDVDAKDREHI